MIRQFLLLLGLSSLGRASQNLFATPTNNTYIMIMKDFMEGFFSYYRLPYPTQVLQCYDEKGTMSFFGSLEISYQLGHDILDGNTKSYRSLVDSIEDLHDELNPFLVCQWQTNDWKEFIHKASPEYELPELDSVYIQSMSKLTRLYSEGQLVELSILLEDMQKELLKGDYYKAGYEYAATFTRSHTFLNSSMTQLLKFEAFDMGFIIAMNFGYEDATIKCYAKSTAKPPIEWYHNLAKVVTEADMTDVTNVTAEFFQNTGPELKIRLPIDVEACLDLNPAMQRILDKFGLDPMDSAFSNALIYFSKVSPRPYYNTMTQIWESFDDWDFLNAGLKFGDLISMAMEKYVLTPEK